MNKKVIGINSSKRKKNTYKILQDIKEQFAHIGIDMDIINLHDYNIGECMGCENCIIRDKCHINDDVSMIMNKMKEYDGIIIATPIYLNNISGKLKTFFDRTCKWVHRPELIGIPIMNIVTTASSGISSTLKYMNNVSILWGAFPTDNISRKVTTMDIKIKPKEYKNFINHLVMPKKSYKPSLNQLMNFAVFKVLALKVIQTDKEYWEKKGWDNKTYYIDAKINIIKKITVKSFYRMMYKKINKV
jgi:multimeric flavodoxin WrbA